MLDVEDPVSVSGRVLFSEKSGMLNGLVELRVMNSISLSASTVCMSTDNGNVLVCDLSFDGLYEAVDILSMKTGVGGVFKTDEFSFSSSLPSSSEPAINCGWLFVPPLKNPCLACALHRLLTGPGVAEGWSSDVLMTPIFLDAEWRLCPAAS